MDKGTLLQLMRDDPVAGMRMLRAHISEQVEERHRLRIDMLLSVASVIEHLMHHDRSLAKFLADPFFKGGRKPDTAAEAVIKYLEEASDELPEMHYRECGQAVERRLLQFSPHTVAKQIVGVMSPPRALARLRVG